MDLTNDIPDFVRDTFVQFGEASSPGQGSMQPVPLNRDSFESKWSELGAILKDTWTRNDVFSFTQIRLCDVVDALAHPIPDEHHLWASTCLAPFVRLTSWEHVRTETGFYELAAALTTPTLIFAFESPHETPQTFVYGPHELVAIPRVVTARTFVFLLQKITSLTHNNLLTSSSTSSSKKKRPAPMDVSPVATVDPSEHDLCATMTVTSENLSEPTSTTHIPVVERLRIGGSEPTSTTHIPVVERLRIGGNATAMISAATATEFSFDLHDIMTKWKSENKRPTVEKICETEQIVHRDVKRWLDSKGLTWTKMLIQYGFRETKN